MNLVASSLVDEVEPDGAVVVLPRLDGDVPHLAPPQERQAVVPDEGLHHKERRWDKVEYVLCPKIISQGWDINIYISDFDDGK